MNITFQELRRIKHSLPTGSVQRIANQLGIEEQTVRNYFGASKFKDGAIPDRHISPGPLGGIVNLKNTEILDLAKQIIAESRAAIHSS